MKKDTRITVRIHSEIKAKAGAVMNSYGLKMTTFIYMLLYQIVSAKCREVSYFCL